MNHKNHVALTPPMGWNSWDCYGAGVTEEDLLANASYMRDHLKDYGWKYVVCDIQWYEPTAHTTQYHKFADLCMDEYSRLLPAENRFPSAKGGKGFSVIAQQIHGMGLKFGIHIMRGIPRQAVHRNTKILCDGVTARDIAAPYSICSWNTDMYGVDPNAKGAQEYYDSLFQLYASWGVDFVKVDDICNTEFRPDAPYSAKREIEMIRKAIDRCGREMVLSLSPGPATIENAHHLSQNANMWRLTGDFWDDRNALRRMFRRCEMWYRFIGEGCWPDCDMLPFGHLNVGAPDDRLTRFTKEDMITVMSLWSVFRSPLMIGANLPDLDDFTLSLLTNRDILALNQDSTGNRPVLCEDDTVIWTCLDGHRRRVFAFFNLTDSDRTIPLPSGLFDANGKTITDLWTGKIENSSNVDYAAVVAKNSATVVRFE